jgi:hypothetical protein
MAPPEKDLKRLPAKALFIPFALSDSMQRSGIE